MNYLKHILLTGLVIITTSCNKNDGTVQPVVVKTAADSIKIHLPPAWTDTLILNKRHRR